MRDFENLKKISVNRCKQRAYYIPYESLEKALKGDKNTTDTSFEFNASLYISEELTEGMHTDEITPFGGTNLRIDYKVSGLGSNSHGPELQEKYRLAEKQIEFVFYIK